LLYMSEIAQSWPTLKLATGELLTEGL
jgi:hypothetical protein